MTDLTALTLAEALDGLVVDLPDGQH